MEEIFFGMGCFWGVEKLFSKQPGIVETEVGYMGGDTPSPNYRQVCNGGTGHVEAIRVVYDPSIVTAAKLMEIFWENHDPTQGDRQGNDIGDQYRSAIFTTNENQLEAALESKSVYQRDLAAAGFRSITTEIGAAGPFYSAETYHQRYLVKNPGGYCALAGTGVTFGSADHP